MDSAVFKVLQKLKEQSTTQLKGLGDFPKADPFEHGVQVGTYRGLEQAISILIDTTEEDARREG